MKRILKQTIKSISFQISYPSSSLTNIRYPYRFGGLPQNNTKPSEINFAKKVFGDDVQEGFKVAYIATLTALRDKDKQFLSSNMEDTLIRDLEFLDVELINEGSPIQVHTCNSFMVFGGKFIRTEDNRKVSYFGDQQGNPRILRSHDYKQKLGTPLSLLLGYEVYFTTACKLINKGQKPTTDPELHMVQFQISNQLPLISMLSIMLKMIKNDPIQGFKEIRGKNYEWKIGDMDQVLNGNFQFLPHNGGFSGLL